MPRVAGSAILRLAAAVAALATMAGLPASGAWEGPATDLHVVAHDDGLRFWFTVDGLAGDNPDIHVEPGALVRLRLSNNGTVGHDFVAQALGGVACCVAPGADGQGQFIAPTQDTRVAYFCEPHRNVGMGGSIVVGAGARQPAPGWTWGAALAALVAALLGRRST